MMGSSHAATGAAAWVALAGTVPGTLGLVGPFDNAGLAAGMVVAAGAALLPDIDHHNGTIAHSLPPISNLAAKLSENLSGGHRKGTHSLFGLGLAGAASVGAAQLQHVVESVGTLHVGAGVGAILLCAFALRALNLTEGRVMTWIASVVLAACVVLFASNDWVWFPSAVVVGTPRTSWGTWSPPGYPRDLAIRHEATQMVAARTTTVRCMARQREPCHPDPGRLRI